MSESLPNRCPCSAFDRDVTRVDDDDHCYCGHRYDDHLDDGLGDCTERELAWEAKPDAESTSAALHRAEQERDAALRFLVFRGQQITDLDRERDELEAEVERLVDLGSKSMQERDLARAELASARQELSGHFGRASALGAQVMELRANVRARDEALASAQQELDAVRTARDNLGRELAEARATIRALTRTQGAGT